MTQKTDSYLKEILNQFDIHYQEVEEHGSGLINNTWKVTGGDKNYILQRINNNVFKKPDDIDSNIRLIYEHIQKHHPEYFFVAPLRTKTGKTIYYQANHGWFRLLPFVEDSITLSVVQTPEQAFQAAYQFGKFTSVLSGINIEELKFTIPDFHNLELRFQQFRKAIKSGNPVRIKESAELIKKLTGRSGIVDDYLKRISHPSFKKRVTHHDTKISNVLFDSGYKGLCVIDLDTVMPGYFFSDVGDMMRTYLCPVSEEEKDFSKISIRKEIYEAVVSGYREPMKDELSKEELTSFLFAGKFLIYMQSLRFLTDYLNNDLYYGSKYEGHNFVRAGNQMVLLERLEELSDY